MEIYVVEVTRIWHSSDAFYPYEYTGVEFASLNKEEADAFLETRKKELEAEVNKSEYADPYEIKLSSVQGSKVEELRKEEVYHHK